MAPRKRPKLSSNKLESYGNTPGTFKSFTIDGNKLNREDLAAPLPNNPIAADSAIIDNEWANDANSGEHGGHPPPRRPEIAPVQAARDAVNLKVVEKARMVDVRSCVLQTNVE